MKSLNELWEENGCKPIKVREKTFDVFVVMNKVPSGEFIGYWLENGEADNFSSYRASEEDWELYEETEEKTLYRAISFDNSIYIESSSLFETEEKAKSWFGKNFVRLLTEYPIKIKVKK